MNAPLGHTHRKVLRAIDSREGTETIAWLKEVGEAWFETFGIEKTLNPRITSYHTVMLDLSEWGGDYEKLLSHPCTHSTTDRQMITLFCLKRKVNEVPFELRCQIYSDLPSEAQALLEQIGKIEWVTQQPYRTIRCGA